MFEMGVQTIEFPKERLNQFIIEMQEGNLNEKIENIILSPALGVLLPLDAILGSIFDIAIILRALKFNKIDDMFLNPLANNLNDFINNVEEFLESIYREK